MTLIVEEYRASDFAVRRPEEVKSMIVNNLFIPKRQKDCYSCALCHKLQHLPDSEWKECSCGLTVRITGGTVYAIAYDEDEHPGGETA